VADRIGMIENEVIAAHGTVLEFTWDAVTGITCLLRGREIASALNSEALADALEKWAAASGLRRSARPSYYVVDDPSLFLDELIASRSF
jgi:hypothetical protein